MKKRSIGRLVGAASLFVLLLTFSLLSGGAAAPALDLGGRPTEDLFDGCPKKGDADTHPSADKDLNLLKNRHYGDVPSSGYKDMHFEDLLDLYSPEVGKKHRATWPKAILGKVQAIEKRAVSVGGYILRVKEEGPESTNCHLDEHQNHDFHLWLANSPDDERSDAVVVEISPRIRGQHPDWTLDKIRELVKNRTQVRVSGLLMYDFEHPEQLDKTRATLWEIHPILKIEVRDGKGWKNL